MEFYVVALMLVLVPYCQCLTSQEEVKECLYNWGKYKQDKMTDMEEHCLRMKDITMCLTRPASGAGSIMDHARFYIFEEDVFLNKYGHCKPAFDLTALRKTIDKSGLRERYQSFLLDNDDPVPCAGDVLKTCTTRYNKLYPNGKMCADHLAYIKCLNDEAEKASCDAPIMKHYIQMNKVVGKSLLSEMEDQIPEDCDFKL